MSTLEADNSLYYEESDYPLYKEDWFWERERHTKENYPNTYVPREHSYNTENFTYFNKRQCPIYTHKLPRNSSVVNNYNYKMKSPIPQTISIDNASKLVLDKLEETYWANWKPKKLTPPSQAEKFRKDLPIREHYDLREYSTTNESNNRRSKKDHQSHGDFDDVFVRYFKSFKPGDPFSHLKKPEEQSHKSESLKREGRKTKTVRVRKSKEKEKIQNTADEIDNNKDEKETDHNTEETENEKAVGQENKDDDDNQIIDVKGTRSTRSIKADIEENKFLNHKDSIVLTKEKFEKEENKEHYQLPRSIRLYRKAGPSSSFLKGGSYPLKTNLRREPTRQPLPKANFRLGAPGSSLLFVTNKTGK